MTRVIDLKHQFFIRKNYMYACVSNSYIRRSIDNKN